MRYLWGVVGVGVGASLLVPAEVTSFSGLCGIRARASRTKSAIETSTIAKLETASESRTPMTLPIRPTVRPLPARSPIIAGL